MSAVLEEIASEPKSSSRSSIEMAVADFLNDGIANAAPGSPLSGIIAHHTPNVVYLHPVGLTIMPHQAVASLIPDAQVDPDGMEVKEYNGRMRISAYAKVLGKDPKDATAHGNAREIADSVYKAAAKLFFNDPSIGGYFKPMTDDINTTYSRV